MSLKWLPNALSLARILVAPLVAYLTYVGMVESHLGFLQWAFGLFVLSAVTDWFDGYLARVLDAKSAIGGKLDLWGDKLLVGLSLVALWLGWLNMGGEHDNLLAAFMNEPLRAWIGIALLIALPLRDAYITNLRARLETQAIFVPPTFLAKSKTTVVMAGMGVIYAGIAHDMMGVAGVGLTILVIGAGMSIITALGYVRAGRV